MGHRTLISKADTIKRSGMFSLHAMVHRKKNFVVDIFNLKISCGHRIVTFEIMIYFFLFRCRNIFKGKIIITVPKYNVLLSNPCLRYLLDIWASFAAVLKDKLSFEFFLASEHISTRLKCYILFGRVFFPNTSIFRMNVYRSIMTYKTKKMWGEAVFICLRFKKHMLLIFFYSFWHHFAIFYACVLYAWKIWTQNSKRVNAEKWIHWVAWGNEKNKRNTKR